MDRRLKLHAELIAASGLASNRVFFQPPETVKLVYPCIVYTLDGVKIDPADNTSYTKSRGYQVTLFERDPDTPILDRLLDLPLCTFSTAFRRDNIYHNILKIYR